MSALTLVDRVIGGSARVSQSRRPGVAARRTLAPRIRGRSPRRCRRKPPSIRRACPVADAEVYVQAAQRRRPSLFVTFGLTFAGAKTVGPAVRDAAVQSSYRFRYGAPASGNPDRSEYGALRHCGFASPEQTTQHNGCQRREFLTCTGTLDRGIPKAGALTA